MPEWLVKGVEITYSVLLPIAVGYIIKLINQIKADKKEAHEKWEDSLANLEKQIEAVNTKLDEHITESNIRDVRRRRTEILDFANTCMNHRKHTQEEFEFIISECDDYEAYCETNNIKNGVATAAINEIKRIYIKCMQEDSFLKEGDE